MKKLTNHHDGPRGINLTNGGTRWIEPGETIEIDAKDIAGDIPDLGKPSDAPAASDDTELVDAIQAENASLKEQVDTLTKANAALTAKLEAATKKA